MSKTTLLCGDLPNIPWQDKPAGCTAPLWRYSDNPVIRRNPLPGVARIFNSAVMPYEGGSGASRPTASPTSTWAAAPTASIGPSTPRRSPS